MRLTWQEKHLIITSDFDTVKNYVLVLKNITLAIGCCIKALQKKF